MESNTANGFQIVEDLIKLRWVPEILGTINLGNHRYSEIKVEIDGISHTELSRKLAILVDKTVISKEDSPDSSNYVLQEFGKELVHIFEHLEKLQEKYLHIL